MNLLDYRSAYLPEPRPFYKGADGVAHALIGRLRRRPSVVSKLKAKAQRVEALARDFSGQGLAEELAATRALFRSRTRQLAAPLRDKALALVVVAAERSLGLRAHTNQIMAALALEEGYLAEMATGEGKTLAVSLAGVLAGWRGYPTHVVTANDYLAERDAQLMAPLYELCGISVGFVTSTMSPPERQLQYRHSVVYTTSKEIVADFLRDRLALGQRHEPARRLLRAMVGNPTSARPLVMRGIHTAIVDEADNVLVDEAVTPLLISQPRKNRAFVESCITAHQIAAQLESGSDYFIEQKFRQVGLTEQGRKRVERLSKELPELWRAASRRTELIERALQAKEFYQRGKQYVVDKGAITIVDDFTGRLLPGRTWQEGLHQSVEVKEGLAPTDPVETLARLSFQRFFRMFQKLSGLSGTAAEAAAEVWRIYHLPVILTPSNKPCRREEASDRVYGTLREKWEAVVEEIAEKHAQGRPILVGTRSVAASELLASKLAKRGLPFQLLNALRHKDEAKIISKAGLRGQITIATNMAGRGTDIRLGPGVVELGGLHVVATERHESRRIDRQLFGRAGRQGDPGSASTFVSLEDELVRRFVPRPIRARAARLLKTGIGAESLFNYAQKSAERMAFAQREQVLQSDDWLEETLAFSGAPTA